MSSNQPRVTAVCVVHAVKPGYFHETAIDKQPLTGPVEVGTLGIAGDRQIDRSHGGRDAAVYVYADEDAAYFAEVLGRDIPPGTFGENVRTSGLDVSGARLGERWRIGDVLLEVRKPRSPCQNLSLHMGISDFHKDFHRSGRVGAKCKVVEQGEIAAGDALIVDRVPDHDVTIATYSAAMDAASARRMLDSGVSLARPVHDRALRVVRAGRL